MYEILTQINCETALATHTKQVQVCTYL